MQHRTLSRAIAAIQVWGGGYGLYFTAVALDQGAARNTGAATVVVLACLYFAASIKAGLDLARERPSAVGLSVAIQIPQLAQLQVGSLVLAIWSGGRVAVGLSGWTLRVNGDIGSYFKLGIFAAGSAGYIDVNLLACVALAVLMQLRSARTSQPKGVPDKSTDADAVES